MIENTLGFLSILLAEDNAINTLFVATVVNQWGCNIMVATNGNEAVDLVSKHHFDLILMDIQMPEKDGIEAAIDIRAMTDITKRNIPIIALTANGLMGFEKHYFNAGINDYLTKPFREKTLYEMIEKVLKKG